MFIVRNDPAGRIEDILSRIIYPSRLCFSYNDKSSICAVSCSQIGDDNNLLGGDCNCHALFTVDETKRTGQSISACGREEGDLLRLPEHVSLDEEYALLPNTRQNITANITGGSPPSFFPALCRQC